MTFISNDDSIAIKAWYYPAILISLKLNPLIFLIVWYSHADENYQLFGES